MPQSVAGLSCAYDCLFLRNIYLFSLMPVFSFSVHLLTSPVTLETLPEASVMSLYLPVPSVVPEAKVLAGSPALVIGQGLAPSEAISSVSLLIKVLGCGGEETSMLGQQEPQSYRAGSQGQGRCPITCQSPCLREAKFKN